MEFVAGIYNLEPGLFLAGAAGIGLALIEFAWKSYKDWAFMRGPD